LTNANYSTFVGLDDKKYSFTKEERELILKRGQKCFEELEKEVVRRVCQRLTTASRNLDFEANGYVSDDDAWPSWTNASLTWPNWSSRPRTRPTASKARKTK
jgi:hypothetical protein